MAADLYPTKTRLALLRQVANSQVMTDLQFEGLHWIVLFPDALTSWEDRRSVTARMEEMERAGWVTTDQGGAWWYPTEAGNAILQANPPAGPDVAT